MALSLPMIARGAVDVTRFYVPDFDKAIKEDERYYRICFYIFADFAPVVLQLASLVFGYIRAQQTKDSGTGRGSSALSPYGREVSDSFRGSSGVLSSRNMDTQSTYSKNSYFDPPLLAADDSPSMSCY